MYLVTASEMRKMDQETIESFGLLGRILMENAGRGATRFLLDQFGDLSNKKIGVVAGRGNNGGDGFVIARYLFQKGIRVTVFLLSKKEKVKGDAADNLKLLDPLDVPVIEVPDKDAFVTHKTQMRHQDLWVDAILGTGLQSEVKGFFKTIIDFINQSDKPVFAVDIPSGLNSDTGQPCGTCIQARATATFAFAKTGHFLFPGAVYTGDLDIVDIGVPVHIANAIRPLQHLLTNRFIRSLLQPRPPDAHKGNTGHVLVIAGSPGKTGAAAMTATSALRAGAGLVTLGIPASLNPILETQVIEAMTHPLPEAEGSTLGKKSFDAIMDLLTDKKCLALGPGIGTSPETQKLVHHLIEKSSKPIVIDADGLNCLVGNAKILKNTEAPIILTPHPGEMARLIDATVGDLPQDRIGFARNFAEKYHIHLVLKGAGTVIAHPDGNVFVNSTGNSGMASGGMGDVLTGVIAGFIAQGYPLETATHLGVYLHGAAADKLAKKLGPYGYLATEVMDDIPKQIKILTSG